VGVSDRNVVALWSKETPEDDVDDAYEPEK